MNDLFFAQMFGRDWIIRNGIYVPIAARSFGLCTNTDDTIGTMKLFGQEGPWVFTRPAMPEYFMGPFGIMLPKPPPMVREYPATGDLCPESLGNAIKGLREGAGFRWNTPIPKDVTELLKPPPQAWYFERPTSHLAEMVFKMNPLHLSCPLEDDDRKTFSEAMLRAQGFDKSIDHLIRIVNARLKVFILDMLIGQQLDIINALMEKEIRRIERASRVGRLIWLGIKLLAGWD